MRAQLSAEIEERGLAALHDELLEIDPEAGARIHPNDPVRTMRALEIFRITGRNASWWYKEQQKMESPYDIFYIAPHAAAREPLSESIERRVKEQFASGYPEEVKWLLDNGYSPSLPALQGFGYRELVDYLAGRCTFLEAIEGDIRSTKSLLAPPDDVVQALRARRVGSTSTNMLEGRGPAPRRAALSRAPERGERAMKVITADPTGLCFGVKAAR